MYSINDLAVMTGLTTRTLRNYIKLGLLEGEKIGGVWKFTPEQFSAFIADRNVKPALEARKKAIVYDFLADGRKPANSVCVILDFCVDEEEGNAISAFFCGAVCECEGMQFSYQYGNGHARVILSGPEDAVQGVMAEYYR